MPFCERLKIVLELKRGLSYHQGPYKTRPRRLAHPKHPKTNQLSIFQKDKSQFTRLQKSIFFIKHQSTAIFLLFSCCSYLIPGQPLSTTSQMSG
ncbi:hypothetical protein TNCT_240701 [Trichonephila clavata]|uniref:Uncharacterized protein n=1 Tax=Trichonephila clavata TaxID=2740835 RepID=A0A8X6LN66_TRICU|nr:hypothetical protein TNCT_240701 [Trichonephila clavata]